ncbi:hypothetical protein BC827DRAFT_1254671 [Russula dissimulans]|jgi:hypothetical protein|nr:hypothetical protein BC827DRAFT_1254671 [Russula dissimulans]
MTVLYVIVISCFTITCYVSDVRIQSRRVPSCFGRSIVVSFASLLTVMVRYENRHNYIQYRVRRTLTKPVAYLYL